MKHSFRNRSIPPVTADQLQSVGIDSADLWFSPTFHQWVFAGQLAIQFPYSSTGHKLACLGLIVNPEA